VGAKAPKWSHSAHLLSRVVLSKLKEPAMLTRLLCCCCCVVVVLLLCVASVNGLHQTIKSMHVCANMLQDAAEGCNHLSPKMELEAYQPRAWSELDK